MLSLKYIDKNLPAHSCVLDRSSFAVKVPRARKWQYYRRAACYAPLFREDYSWGGASYWSENNRFLIVPTVAKTEVGLSNRMFSNVFAAFQQHGFFPPEATLLPDKLTGRLALYLPKNTTTILSLKMASFVYRLMDSRNTKCILRAYRQWLHLKNKGVTLWQCLLWSGYHSNLTTGHGLYDCHTLKGRDPYTILAFAYFCNLPKKIKKEKFGNISRASLTERLDAIADSFKLPGGPSISLTDEGVLSPSLGRILMTAPNINAEEFAQVVDRLPFISKLSPIAQDLIVYYGVANV